MRGDADATAKSRPAGSEPEARTRPPTDRPPPTAPAATTALAPGRALPDWNAPTSMPRGDVARVIVRTLLFLAAVLAFDYALGGFDIVPLAVIFLGGATWLEWRRQGPKALRSVRAVRVDAKTQPRLVNLATGIAGDLGMPAPHVWMFQGIDNAFVCRADGPAIAVSESFAKNCTRTELEAVVAHCLVRLRRGALASRAAAFMGRFAAGRPACYAAADDVRAAAITRFPPALASAIAKAAPYEGANAPLWFVARGEGDCSREARSAAIADL